MGWPAQLPKRQFLVRVVKLRVKEGILVSFPSPLRGHVYQYSVSELLNKSGYDMNLCLLAYIRSKEVGWSRFEWS